MEKSFTHVIKIGWSKLNKHLELRFLNFFENVLFVVRLIKFSFSFPSSGSPGLGLQNRSYELLMGTTVESSQSLKALWIEDFDLKVDSLDFQEFTQAKVAFCLLNKKLF